MSRHVSPLEPGKATRHSRRLKAIDVAAFVVLVAVTAAVVALSVAAIAWAISTI